MAFTSMAITGVALTEREKGAHLLRRFGLGASEAELDYYLQDGLKGAIERLLNYDTQPEVVEISTEMLRNKNGNLPIQTVAGWWAAKMLITRRPLQEKMTLFWHNHFATSGDKVVNSTMMIAQNEKLRAFATSKFKTLLLEVSRDPAMLVWLDGQDNIKGRANENFARELFELFTLGVGHYEEKDIQEAARAFTGWSFVRGKGSRYARAEYLFKPALHDSGLKTVLGKSGNLTGEDVIDHVCSLPRTAEFIVQKLWNWFVYPHPQPATLKPFIDGFIKSDLDIKVLLRQIMTSEEFYSERSIRMVVKNPVDFCLTTLRAMGIGETIAQGLASVPPMDDDDARQTALRSKIGIAVACGQAMKNQGMWLLFPPDVSGWKPGEAWITSATMVERINWANRILGTTGRGTLGRYPIFNLLSADTTPMGIAQKLCSIYDAPIKGRKLVLLAEAAEKAMAGEPLTQKNAPLVASTVTKLIFGTPEYQFA
jgi:uncharacterized protein (DUF1800 family)